MEPISVASQRFASIVRLELYFSGIWIKISTAFLSLFLRLLYFHEFLDYFFESNVWNLDKNINDAFEITNTYLGAQDQILKNTQTRWKPWKFGSANICARVTSVFNFRVSINDTSVTYAKPLNRIYRIICLYKRRKNRSDRVGENNSSALDFAAVFIEM